MFYVIFKNERKKAKAITKNGKQTKTNGERDVIILE